MLMPSFSARRAAAQAHSRVRLTRWFLASSTYSIGGGLTGDAIGDEGILSHRLAPGSRRRVGVRGVAARSSVRDATRSRDGREEVAE